MAAAAGLAGHASRLAGGNNGTALKSGRKRAPARKKAMVKPAPRLALGITVGMGIGIPGLVLSLSTIAGQLARSGHYPLAGVIGAVCGTVLAVSLSHLAWAVRDITRSAWWASWALAVAVDCGLVACEIVTVSAPGVCDALARAVMVCVTIASMALNCWAFLRHR